MQRLVVAGSCVAFYILAARVPLARSVETGLLVLLALLACVEKLCAIMNLVAVERDWVGGLLSGRWWMLADLFG